jgi:hypothetical protein
MPRPEAVDRYVVLTNTDSDSPWAAVVENLARRRNGTVVRFRGDDPAAARPDLSGLSPSTVAVVIAPETLDVDFVYRLVETASSLDGDFALDFRIGIVTGLTPQHAVEMLDREARVEADPALLPKRLVDFGPSDADLELQGEQAWLEGWDRVLLRHLKTSEAEVKKLEAAGVLQFWGYGRPEGIAGSVDAGQLAAVDLFPAVAFGGPIYTGVTHRWYEGPVTAAPRPEKRTTPEASFVLALLARGATGAFGSTDPGHGVTAMQESEWMLTAGGTLGATHKAQADAALLHLREAPVRLPKVADGKAAPSRDWGAVLARGALSRVAFGDPSFRPSPSAASEPWRLEIERLENGLRVKATLAEPRLKATLTDVFQYGFGRKDALLNARMLVQVPWPDDLPLPYRLRVIDAKSGAREIRVGPAAAAVELWGPNRFIHVQLDFPAQSLAAGTEARFLLRTGAAGEDQDRETLFESARAQSDAIVAGREASGGSSSPDPARWNLWDGAAGAATFQMNLLRATNDGSQGQRARDLLDAMILAAERDGAACRWTDAWRMPDGTLSRVSSDGLHGGTAGIGAAFLEAYRLFGDKKYLDAAAGAGARLEAAAKREDGMAYWGDDTTVAGGAAGILLFLLDLAEGANDPRWRGLALEAAAWLDRMKVEDRHGASWRAQLGVPRVHTGFAHGVAGVGFALLRVHEATGDPRWLTLATLAASWLDRAAEREEGILRWPAVTGEGDAVSLPGISYGAAGISRFFLRLHRVSREPTHLEAALAAGRWVKREMEAAADHPFAAAGLESGGAGFGELMLDLFEATRDGGWRDEATRIAETLRTRASASAGPWSSRWDPERPILWEGEGLYRGAAGVGMFYLRLATIDMDARKRPRAGVDLR